jgi:hypothetical protein
MFTNTYDVESPARNVHASGRVETTLVLTIIDGALKVVDQKEIARPTRR